MSSSNPFGKPVAGMMGGQGAGEADLKGIVARQNLLIQTLIRILIEKKVMDEDEFNEWIVYMDKLDGVEDGRLTEKRQPKSCRSCGRVNSPLAQSCQYCGVTMPMNYIIKEPKRE